MNLHLEYNPPSLLPSYLELPWQQTAIAIDCLQKKKLQLSENSLEQPSEQGHPLLPYLIHTSVLLFLLRDMLAFSWVKVQPLFKDSPISSRIRQTPSIDQSIALLKSTEATAVLAEMLAPITDQAINASNLHQFRNHITQWGIPCDNSISENNQQNADSPFPIPTFSYTQLSQDAITMWQALQTWYSEHSSQ